MDRSDQGEDAKKHQQDSGSSSEGCAPSRALSSLYRATFLFGLACGVSLALTPLHLEKAGYNKEEMGTMALFFAAGLVVFSLPVSWLLRRLGPKMTLATALGGYACAVAAFPFMGSYTSIAGVRFFDGAFSICVWISSETIVLARADRRHKAHLTSLYAIWLASGYVAGPLLARLLSNSLNYRELFLMAATVACSAAIYVTMRVTAGSATPTQDLLSNTASVVRPSSSEGAAPRASGNKVPLSMLVLLRCIRTSCFATFSYGYFQAAVVLFLPLYLMESKGILAEDTIILPGLFCLGMLLFSNVAGRWGDRFGHLFVMSALSTVGMGCVFGFVFVDNYYLMCLLVFLAGATLAAMSPIALALTGVVVPAEQLGRANSIYNTFYATGILLGPPISSLLFARYGGGLMLYHLAALWASFIVFAIIFARDDPAFRGRRLSLRFGRSPAQ